MKKKILAIVLAVVMVLGSAATLAGCKKNKHTHEYGAEWQSNAEQHWRVCDCGEKKDLADHTFGAGVIAPEPTLDAAGTKTFTCTVCNYKKTESVAQLQPLFANVADFLAAIYADSLSANFTVEIESETEGDSYIYKLAGERIYYYYSGNHTFERYCIFSEETSDETNIEYNRYSFHSVNGEWAYNTFSWEKVHNILFGNDGWGGCIPSTDNVFQPNGSNKYICIDDAYGAFDVYMRYTIEISATQVTLFSECFSDEQMQNLVWDYFYTFTDFGTTSVTKQDIIDNVDHVSLMFGIIPDYFSKGGDDLHFEFYGKISLVETLKAVLMADGWIQDLSVGDNGIESDDDGEDYDYTCALRYNNEWYIFHNNADGTWARIKMIKA